jgi:hypothetical protein
MGASDALVRKVDSVSVSAFKVIGSDGGLAKYVTQHPATHEQDWSGIYLQLSAENAIGTLGYRWDQGYVTAQLLVSLLTLLNHNHINTHSIYSCFHQSNQMFNRKSLLKALPFYSFHRL